VDADRSVDIHELAATTLLAAPLPTQAKVALLLTWFDHDGDQKVTNFDMLFAFETLTKALSRLGVVEHPPVQQQAIEREVCRAFLCYYKQVPPPTDSFSLLDAMRWFAQDPQSVQLLLLLEAASGSVVGPEGLLASAAAMLDKAERVEAAREQRGLKSKPKPHPSAAHERGAQQLLPRLKAIESWRAVHTSLAGEGRKEKVKMRAFFQAVCPQAKDVHLDVFEVWVEHDQKDAHMTRRRVLSALAACPEPAMVPTGLDQQDLDGRSMTINTLLAQQVIHPDVVYAVLETFTDWTLEAYVDELRFNELFVPEYLPEELQLDFLRAFRVCWLNNDSDGASSGDKENVAPRVPNPENDAGVPRPRCASRPAKGDPADFPSCPASQRTNASSATEQPACDESTADGRMRISAPPVRSSPSPLRDRKVNGRAMDVHQDSRKPEIPRFPARLAERTASVDASGRRNRCRGAHEERTQAPKSLQEPRSRRDFGRNRGEDIQGRECRSRTRGENRGGKARADSQLREPYAERRDGAESDGRVANGVAAKESIGARARAQSESVGQERVRGSRTPRGGACGNRSPRQARLPKPTRPREGKEGDVRHEGKRSDERQAKVRELSHQAAVRGKAVSQRPERAGNSPRLPPLASLAAGRKAKSRSQSPLRSGRGGPIELQAKLAALSAQAAAAEARCDLVPIGASTADRNLAVDPRTEVRPLLERGVSGSEADSPGREQSFEDDTFEEDSADDRTGAEAAIRIFGDVEAEFGGDTACAGEALLVAEDLAETPVIEMVSQTQAPEVEKYACTTPQTRTPVDEPPVPDIVITDTRGWYAQIRADDTHVVASKSEDCTATDGTAAYASDVMSDAGSIELQASPNKSEPSLEERHVESTPTPTPAVPSPDDGSASPAASSLASTAHYAAPSQTGSPLVRARSAKTLASPSRSLKTSPQMSSRAKARGGTLVIRTDVSSQSLKAAEPEYSDDDFDSEGTASPVQMLANSNEVLARTDGLVSP
jgi:hypothetical protein